MSSSTLRSQNPDSLAANAVFYRDARPKVPVIYVEGDKDYKLFSHLFKKASCQIVQCNGKNKVIATITKLNKFKIPGVLAIADADFDRLMSEGLKVRDNLYYTDSHDSETMILQGDTFDALLSEYADEEKIQQFYQYHDSPLQVILGICSKIGFVEYYSQNFQTGLCFKEVHHNRFIDDEYFTFDYKGFVTALINGSKSLPYKDKVKKDLLDGETRFQDKIWDICRGHDLTDVISFFFKHYGSEKFLSYYENSDKVESLLRMSYHHKMFEETALYSSLKKWQTEHAALADFLKS